MARHSRLQLSTTVKARNRLPLYSASLTKSMLHTKCKPGPWGRSRRWVPALLLGGRLLRRFNPSSLYTLCTRFWLLSNPPVWAECKCACYRNGCAWWQSLVSWSAGPFPRGGGNGSNTSNGRRTTTWRSVAPILCTGLSGDRSLCASGAASELFLYDVLQHLFVQAQVGHHLLQLRVFFF